MPNNLTPADLAEGRRLLDETEAGGPLGRISRRTLEMWLMNNRHALLADREAVDVESVKREAVREFARKVASKFGANSQSWSVLANVDSLPTGRELARARSDLWLAAADEAMVMAARGVKLESE